LMSDGGETTGRAERAADEARHAGVAVDVMAPTETAPFQVSVTDISAPEEVHRGEPFDLRVRLAGPARTRVHVQVTSGDAVVHDGIVTLDAAGAADVHLARTETATGIHAYRAGAVSAAAGTGALDWSDAVGVTTSVSGDPEVLVVAETTSPIAGVI